MGGRGVHSGDNNAQTSFATHMQRQDIEFIKDKYDNLRLNFSKQNASDAIGGALGNRSKRIGMKKCSCCLRYTIPAFTTYEKCPICGWIDDPVQNEDATLKQGRNEMSLKEAREKWKGFNS